MLKKPIQSTGYSHLASKVVFAKQGLDLAGPVNGCSNASDLRALGRFAGPVRTCAVSGDVEPGRTCSPDGFKDLVCCRGAIKNQKENRTVHEAQRGEEVKGDGLFMSATKPQLHFQDSSGIKNVAQNRRCCVSNNG